jgi:hypothetical protein
LISLIDQSPDFKFAWIALGRLEVQTGNSLGGKSILMAACRRFPLDAGIWLELSKVVSKGSRSAVLGKALNAAGNDERLWLEVIREISPGVRREGMLRRALNCLPSSLAL